MTTTWCSSSAHDPQPPSAATPAGPPPSESYRRADGPESELIIHAGSPKRKRQSLRCKSGCKRVRTDHGAIPFAWQCRRFKPV